MDYQLLKINNVTKLCDDRIIQDKKGNILDIQWFDFQLHILCDLIDVPIFNNNFCPEAYHEATPKPVESNYLNTFTRNQIFRELKEIFGSSMKDKIEIVTIPLDKTNQHLEKLENTGFSNSKIYKLFKPTLNKDNKCNIIPISYTDGTIVSEIYYTDDKSILDKIEKHSITDDKLYNVDLVDESESDEEDIIKKEASEDDVVTLGAVDTCNKFGKLIWTRNSCYADSPIFLFFLRMLQNPTGTLSKNILESYVTVDSVNDKRCFIENADGTSYTVENNAKSVEILNRIRIKFRELFEKFKTGTDTNIEELRAIFKECNGVTTKKWSEGEFQDSDEFLLDLFRMLQIKYPPENSNLSRTNRFTEYFYSKDNSNLDLINKTLRKYGDSNFNAFFDSDGTPMYNDKHETINNSQVDIQYLDIQYISIINKFIFHTDLQKYIQSPSDLAALPANRKYFSDILQREFIKKDRTKINNAIKVKSINIMDILDVKNDVNSSEPTDGGIETYHMKDPNYQFNDDNTKFFKKDDPDKLLELDELGDRGFRQVLKIEHPELDNQSEDIFIFLRKLTGNDQLVPLKIDNIEEINVDGTIYKLNGLVYWKNNHYMTMFKCNNAWYKFDDGPGIGPKIQPVGSYQHLMNYEKNIIKKNTTIYHYVRQ
jgi:hypothetical protein